VWADGTIEWYRHGKLHREGGPALITPLQVEWWRQGVLHRDDRPAVIFNNGASEFWVNGKLVRKEDVFPTQSTVSSDKKENENE
jgi:hypothetical protein